MSAPLSDPPPPFRPERRPIPQRRAPRPAASDPAKPRRKIPWGWLEVVVISQTVLPALLFIPGIAPLRTGTRVAAYAIGLVVWAAVLFWGSRTTLRSTFPSRNWLIFSMIWLVLSIGHPNSYSLPAAVAQVLLYVSILSPALWAGDVLTAPQQMGRVMALLFLCNAASATVGVGQAFYPDRLNPPEIPALKGRYQGEDLMYETADGRKILRPCGLSDTPGNAAPAGATAALIGLCLALRPIGIVKRLICAGLAFLGAAAIYYTQVRTPLVMLVLCFTVLTVLFSLQRRYNLALGIVGSGALLVASALAWVARSVGGRVIERFSTLISSDPGNLYYRSRGSYVTEALGKVVWEYPLGYGMGWWGVLHGLFARADRISPVWVEVMIPAWVYDGGFPLLIAYGGAVVVALYDSVRIALTSRDPEVAFWAAVIVAQNLSLTATCFSYPTFLSPLGLQFWLLSAMLHAADQQTRATAARAARRRRLRWLWLRSAAAPSTGE